MHKTSKSNTFPPKKSKTYRFETQSENGLPISIRSYAKGLKEYSVIDQRIRQNIGSAKFITPIISWLDDISHSLTGAKEIIQSAIDNDSYTNIREQLIIEGESFCSTLLAKPSPPNFNGATDKDELVIEQVIDYFEDLCNRIANELIDIYHYLIGAKF